MPEMFYQASRGREHYSNWIPAFAGMTNIP
jgi:hypothetical protein